MKNLKLKEIEDFVLEKLSAIDIDQSMPAVLVNLILNSLINLYKIDPNNEQLIVGSFEKHESIKPDIESSLKNPNCTCRARFGDFIAENIKECSDIFLEIAKGQEENALDEILNAKKFSIEKAQEMIKSINTPNDFSGKVIKIKNSSEEFYEKIKTLKKYNAVYTGISIVENGEFLNLYFY
jgi:hypothetical protein